MGRRRTVITEIHAAAFSTPVTVCPGDTLTVTHTVAGPGVKNYGVHKVVEHKADFTVTWTHSILFKLDGQQQWIVGTQQTIDWLRSIQNSQPVQRPLTPLGGSY